jgi:putative FmdB family regulatory protein
MVGAYFLLEVKMPIYEYLCSSCGHCFEKLHLSADKEKPDCPECTSRKVSRRMSAGNVRAQGIPTGSGGFKPPPCKA